MKASRGHVHAIDWLGALGILFLLGALAMLAARCRPIVPPAPPPPDADAAPIEPTNPGDCASACATLRRLECNWTATTTGPDGVMGTADDGTCEAVCEEAEREPETTLNPACVAQAGSCIEAERCTW